MPPVSLNWLQKAVFYFKLEPSECCIVMTLYYIWYLVKGSSLKLRQTTLSCSHRFCVNSCTFCHCHPHKGVMPTYCGSSSICHCIIYRSHSIRIERCVFLHESQGSYHIPNTSHITLRCPFLHTSLITSRAVLKAALFSWLWAALMEKKLHRNVISRKCINVHLPSTIWSKYDRLGG